MTLSQKKAAMVYHWKRTWPSEHLTLSSSRNEDDVKLMMQMRNWRLKSTRPHASDLSSILPFHLAMHCNRNQHILPVLTLTTTWEDF
jgi:hypothetical protein